MRFAAILFFCFNVLLAQAQLPNACRAVSPWYSYNQAIVSEINQSSSGFMYETPVDTLPLSNILALAYNSDLSRFYLLTDKKQVLFVYNTQDGTLEELPLRLPAFAEKDLATTSLGKAMAWANGKLWLYCTYADSLVGIDIHEKTTHCTSRKMSIKIASDALAFNPQNQLLYAIDKYKNLYEITASTGNVLLAGQVRNLPNKDNAYTALWFSGGWLWTGRKNEKECWMIDINSQPLPVAFNIPTELHRMPQGIMACAQARPPLWLRPELMYLNAQAMPNNNVIKINWAVANSPEMDYYQLEKSTDNRLWTAYGDPKPASDITDALVPYGELDRSNIQAAPISYYRLFALRKDRSSFYSHSIQFPAPTDTSQTQAFLSPLLGDGNKMLHLQGWKDQGLLSIFVYNANGKLLDLQSHFVLGNDYKIMLQQNDGFRGWLKLLLVGSNKTAVLRGFWGN